MKLHFDSVLFSPKIRGYSAHSRENRLCLVTLSETDQYNMLFSACNLNVYPFPQISSLIQAFAEDSTTRELYTAVTRHDIKTD